MENYLTTLWFYLNRYGRAVSRETQASIILRIQHEFRLPYKRCHTAGSEYDSLRFTGGIYSGNLPTPTYAESQLHLIPFAIT